MAISLAREPVYNPRAYSQTNTMYNIVNINLVSENYEILATPDRLQLNQLEGKPINCE